MRGNNTTLKPRDTKMPFIPSVKQVIDRHLKPRDRTELPKMRIPHHAATGAQEKNICARGRCCTRDTWERSGGSALPTPFPNSSDLWVCCQWETRTPKKQGSARPIYAVYSTPGFVMGQAELSPIPVKCRCAWTERCVSHVCPRLAE